MSSRVIQLQHAYDELSKLYKNPTRPLQRIAAVNQETALAEKYATLWTTFLRANLSSRKSKPAVYFKALSLLFEVDIYRGLSPTVEKYLDAEAPTLMKELESRDERQRTIQFKDRKARSAWKAKIRCCVSHLESKRKTRNLAVLADELRTINEFTEKYLHRPDEDLPAWTTWAFVQAAQARIAREHQDYSDMQVKMFQVDQCLDKRACEIIEKLSEPKLTDAEIDELSDDLIFIRQKQTLASLFNVGLAAFQRGFLRTAENACQAARLPFRLHGQYFDRLFNDLILLSIERARTSRHDLITFQRLKSDLQENILPHLKPVPGPGNPRLCVFALRELAVLQYYCDECEEVLATLKEMEQAPARDRQWDSRIGVLRARVFWRRWVDAPADSKSEDVLKQALAFAVKAFDDASGLNGAISTYRDARNLRMTLEASTHKSLIDVMESLLIYSSVQLGLKDFAEAQKSATTVIELAADENPRLLAMGHLAMAEVYVETKRFIAADQHLSKARNLDSQIDHEYVRDRRIAVEKRVSRILDLDSFTAADFAKAQDRLMGWFIEHRTTRTSINAVASQLKVDRKEFGLISIDSPHRIIKMTLTSILQK